MDSLYVQKSALHRLDGVESYVLLLTKEEMWDILTLKPTRPGPRPVQWREKGENLYPPDGRAEYYPKLEQIKQDKPLPYSTAPHYDDPLTRHQRSYLNGG